MFPGNQDLAAVPGEPRFQSYYRPMTWRTKRMMRRSKPRVSESRLLGSGVSILWSAVGIAVVILLAIGLFLYLPGTNGIEAPAVTVP